MPNSGGLIYQDKTRGEQGEPLLEHKNCRRTLGRRWPPIMQVMLLTMKNSLFGNKWWQTPVVLTQGNGMMEANRISIL